MLNLFALEIIITVLNRFDYLILIIKGFISFDLFIYWNIKQVNELIYQHKFLENIYFQMEKLILCERGNLVESIENYRLFSSMSKIVILNPELEL